MIDDYNIYIIISKLFNLEDYISKRGDKYPKGVGATLARLMNYYGTTRNELALVLNVCDRYIYEYTHNQRKLGIENTVIICLYYNLGFRLSIQFIKIAGYNLNPDINSFDSKAVYALENNKNKSIDEWISFLFS